MTASVRKQFFFSRTVVRAAHYGDRHWRRRTGDKPSEAELLMSELIEFLNNGKGDDAPIFAVERSQ